jgi:hypothetical protein
MANAENGGREAEALRAMLREAGCRESTAERLAAALRWPVECDVAQLSVRALMGASALLDERARAVWRRQASSVLIAALATLPLWLVAAAFVIEEVFELLCGVMPTAVATYLVSTYAIVALGVVGATYAMIPIVIDRARDRMALTETWEVAR